MNEKIEHLLNEYVDGMLSEAMQAEVEEILAQSAEARAYVAELKTLFGSLDLLDEQPVPIDFSQAVMAQVRETAVSPWANYWLLGQLILVGLLFILAWPILRTTALDLLAQVNWTATLPQLSLSTFWLSVREGLTAVSTPAQPFPSLNLEPTQLTWLLVGAFSIWLISNGYFLSKNSE